MSDEGSMGAKVAIVGYRSWIGQALAERLEFAGYEVTLVSKRDAAMLDTRDHVAMFIIPGKLQQTQDEMEAERKLVKEIGASGNTPRRLILISSQSALTKMTDYGAHKYIVEIAFQYGASLQRKETMVVRPGAIFGPGQDINAPMLIPQIAREGTDIQLSTPERVTKFVSINHLTKFLVAQVDRFSLPGTEDVPGTFEATPSAIRDLWTTFQRMAPR